LLISPYPSVEDGNISVVMLESYQEDKGMRTSEAEKARKKLFCLILVNLKLSTFLNKSRRNHLLHPDGVNRTTLNRNRNRTNRT